MKHKSLINHPQPLPNPSQEPNTLQWRVGLPGDAYSHQAEAGSSGAEDALRPERLFSPLPHSSLRQMAHKPGRTSSSSAAR